MSGKSGKMERDAGEIQIWSLNEATALSFFGLDPIRCSVRVLEDGPSTERDRGRYSPEAKLYGIVVHAPMDRTLPDQRLPAPPFTSAQLDALSRRINACAMEIAREPCSTHKPSVPVHSCIQAEETRPLTKDEKKRGWERRPFDAYDDSNLCTSCSAYWHASVAAVRGFDLARRAQFVEAETERKS